ncbi:MAG: insulinase family protein [Phycisphaerales bacterium]|nr:insulinase family protein [Phycisphaerales bacterium]
MQLKTLPRFQNLLMSLVIGLVFAGAAAAEGTEKTTLKNGIKVLLIPIKDSPNINIITWVPFGLCHDQKDQAQWSHLIEHLVSQSTGEASFQEINAETLPDGMHLDYSRPADTWKDGIDYHVRWLSMKHFTEANVKHEIPRVIKETESISQAGHTHKFAFGAWAQAVGFGTSHVEMLGDVRGAEAKTKELFNCYRRNFLTGRTPVIAISGKFERDALLKELEKRIGKIALPPAPGKPRPANREIPIRITWDLASRHLIFYWPLPDTTDHQRAELLAASKSLMMSWFTTPSDYRPHRSFVSVEDRLEVAGRAYLVVNMTLHESDKDALESARRDAAKFVKALLEENSKSRQTGRIHARVQHKQFDDVDRTVAQSMTQRMPNGQTIPRKTIEGNVAVQMGMMEFRYDGKMSDYVEILTNPDDAKAREFLKKVFASGKRQELLIEPKR